MRASHRQNLYPSTRQKITLATLTGFCLLAALFSYAFGSDCLTVAIAALCLIPPAAAGIMTARDEGILSPFTVFSIAFSAYNGLLLLRFCYLGETDFPYPIAVDQTTLLHSAMLSSVGSLGLVVGWLLAPIHKRRVFPFRERDESLAALITGLLFYIIALGFYFLQYAQLGGYVNAMAMDRGEKFELMRDTVSTPYVAFALVGLALSFYASLGKSPWRLRVSLLMLLLWSALVALQGDRRLVLQAVLAVFLVVGTIRPFVTKFRPFVLLMVLLGVFAAMIFGQYRSLIGDLASRGMSINELTELAGRPDSLRWVMPENTEFGGPYLSVLDVAQHRRAALFGMSYLDSFSAIVPQKIYPVKKATPISEELASSVHVGVGPTYGWGYSPVAEAYLNFGIVGIFVIMAIWSRLFLWLGAVRYRSLAGLLMCAVLLQEAVNVNRIDFRYLFQESFFNVGAAMAGLLCVLSVRSFLFKRHPACAWQFRLVRQH